MTLPVSDAMKTFKITEARANLSKLVEEACRGKEIVITRRDGKAVRLAPVLQSKGSRTPGALKGSLHVGSEFFEPLPSEEAEGWG
jgi:prevent-host-death family protein